MNCPLCKTAETEAFLNDKVRGYFKCRECGLVFVPPEQYLSPEQEKAEYDRHDNSPDDPGYRKFLGRLFEPMRKQIPTHSNGLDFGCGPGPALPVMFEEAGYKMAVFDCFYANNPAMLSRQYDFITCTEVVEHLHHPAEELERLWNCLKPGGTLGIMTKLALDREKFANWHYKRDLTHVCFFSQATFQWLAAKWQAKLTFVDNDVIILYKNEE
jgi:SAM-dependent methyltransferase